MPKVKSELQVVEEVPEVIDAEVLSTALVPYAPGQSPALQQEMPLAQVFAASGIFADAKQASQAAVKILAGRDLGIPPTVAMTGIYMVKGRLTLSANLMAALVKRSPRYNYRVKVLTNTLCEITFFDTQSDHFDAEVGIGTSSFSLDDAKLAGVAHGDNWKKYPRNMLFSRALSNGVRWFCPDLFLGGVYTTEEIGNDLATSSVEAAQWLPELDAEASQGD